MQPSRLLTLSFFLAAAWASSCASETASDLRSGGTAAPSPTSTRDPNIDTLSLGGSAGGAPQKLNALCGSPGQCNPDSVTDCRDFMPPNASGGAPGAGVGGSVAAGGASGATATAGFGGMSGGEAGSENAAGRAGALASAGTAGVLGLAGTAGVGPLNVGGASSGASTGAGGNHSTGGAAQLVPPTFPGTPSAPTYACRIERGTESQALAQCALAGAGKPDDPCNSSADCNPGLGCVGDSALARCRPFCCGNSDICAPGSYCANEPLRDPTAGATTPLSVPVCVAADNCDLGEPFPCPTGRTCTCSAGTACSVVRPDGTTSCVEPGRGLEGQACPCSAGHICSQGSGLCLKLCRTTDTDATCGVGRCQIAAGLPTGYGVCVGVPAPNGGAGGQLGAANQ